MPREMDKAPTRIVLSGHGMFDEVSVLHVEDKASKARSLRLRTKEKATFKLPENVQITFYAPDGAFLENDVANKIEQGVLLTNRDLVLRKKHGPPKCQDLPAEYPRTFKPGADVINYKLTSPMELKVIRGPGVMTVDEPTTLVTLCESFGKQYKSVHVHWAACCKGYLKRFAASFEKGNNWRCDLRIDENRG